MRIWADALLAPPFVALPRWLHGDLHPADIVADRGSICGILDLGELCAGDPASDLAVAWTVLPASQREPFFDAYEGADVGTRRRASGWALSTAVSLLQIGHAGIEGRPGGKPTWLVRGQNAIAAILDDENT